MLSKTLVLTDISIKNQGRIFKIRPRELVAVALGIIHSTVWSVGLITRAIAVKG
jgi:hypothetical protein